MTHDTGHRSQTRDITSITSRNVMQQCQWQSQNKAKAMSQLVRHISHIHHCIMFCFLPGAAVPFYSVT